VLICKQLFAREYSLFVGAVTYGVEVCRLDCECVEQVVFDGHQFNHVALARIEYGELQLFVALHRQVLLLDHDGEFADLELDDLGIHIDCYHDVGVLQEGFSVVHGLVGLS